MIGEYGKSPLPFGVSAQALRRAQERRAARQRSAVDRRQRELLRIHTTHTRGEAADVLGVEVSTIRHDEKALGIRCKTEAREHSPPALTRHTEAALTKQTQQMIRDWRPV